ncbi:hypothetical protein DERP_002210 [Dermatophagoides pteronyssinus]|uniref:Uncharacterized protein n=1 Tax=Dermatophagoides pteronyssinus TaxID=6956 RepID=A0ABQ8JHN8_DERPT|nr:hypothetical protein DERP_002210 [Dermatophagoides pteronyssinus]
MPDVRVLVAELGVDMEHFSNILINLSENFSNDTNKFCMKNGSFGSKIRTDISSRISLNRLSTSSNSCIVLL